MVALGIVTSRIGRSRNGRVRNGRVRNGRSRIGRSRNGTSTDYFLPFLLLLVNVRKYLSVKRTVS
jgi:hypothetical protein